MIDHAGAAQPPGLARFPTTHWSRIAGAIDLSTPGGRGCFGFAVLLESSDDGPANIWLLPNLGVTDQGPARQRRGESVQGNCENQAHNHKSASEVENRGIRRDGK
jgi:hypothetical protein